MHPNLLLTALLCRAEHVVHKARWDIAVLLVHLKQLSMGIFRLQHVVNTATNAGGTATGFTVPDKLAFGF